MTEVPASLRNQYNVTEAGARLGSLASVPLRFSRTLGFLVLVRIFGAATPAGTSLERAVTASADLSCRPLLSCGIQWSDNRRAAVKVFHKRALGSRFKAQVDPNHETTG